MGRIRRGVGLASATAALLLFTAVPAQANGDVQHFTHLPINDVQNPCGSAVGDAFGHGTIRTDVRDGSSAFILKFRGSFEVQLTNDPIPNPWDPAATAAEGTLTVSVREGSDGSFAVTLNVTGVTDTGVPMRIREVIRVGPSGSGFIEWNCFDGTGVHRIDF